MLGHLVLHDELDRGSSFESSQAAALNSPPPKLALGDGPKPSLGHDAEEEISFGLEIFNRVLQKKTSDPSSPNFKAPQDPVGEESFAPSSKQQNMLVGSQGPAQAKSSS